MPALLFPLVDVPILLQGRQLLLSVIWTACAALILCLSLSQDTRMPLSLLLRYAAACCGHAAWQTQADTTLADASGKEQLLVTTSHHIVFARALCSLVASECLLCHVSDDGLAFVLGCLHLSLSGTLNEQVQLPVIVWDLLALVVEATPDGDGCACQLIDLGNGLTVCDLQHAHISAYVARLLVELTSKGVVFSFLFCTTHICTHMCISCNQRDLVSTSYIIT